jgi:general stress protein 26
VEHLLGAETLPRVVDALKYFEPAVLLTAEGRGAIYAPSADDPGHRRLWFLADARAALDWEAERGRNVTLTFHSRDERVFISLSGGVQVVTAPSAGELWRPSFSRWFPGGHDDPRLLRLLLTVDDAEYFEAPGRVSAHLSG